MIKILEDTQTIEELYGDEPIEDVIKEEKENFNDYLKKIAKAQKLIEQAYKIANDYKNKLDNVKDEKTLKELFNVNSKIHDLLWESDL